MSAKGQKQLESIYEAQLILSKINNECSLLQENILTSSLNIGEWFLKAIPYIKNVGLSLVGVNLISKVLEYLGKKANTVSEEDAKRSAIVLAKQILKLALTDEATIYWNTVLKTLKENG